MLHPRRGRMNLVKPYVVSRFPNVPTEAIKDDEKNSPFFGNCLRLSRSSQTQKPWRIPHQLKTQEKVSIAKEHSPTKWSDSSTPLEHNWQVVEEILIHLLERTIIEGIRPIQGRQTNLMHFGGTKWIQIIGLIQVWSPYCQLKPLDHEHRTYLYSTTSTSKNEAIRTHKLIDQPILSDLHLTAHDVY